MLDVGVRPQYARRMGRWLLILSLSLVLSHCRQADLVSWPTDATNDAWAYRSWIAKAGRYLQAGAPLDPDAVNTLASLPPAAVIDHLLAQAGFGDTALDFSLFYLGFKPAQLYQINTEDGTRRYSPSAYAKPQAIAAAKAIVSDGDLWRILDHRQERFFPPLLPLPNQSADASARDLAMRRDALQKALAALTQIEAAFYSDDHNQAPDKMKGCRFLINQRQIFDLAVLGLEKAGLNSMSIFHDLSRGLLTNIMSRCADQTLEARHVLSLLTELRPIYEHMLAVLPSLQASAYMVHGLQDIRALPPLASPLFQGSAYTHMGFWSTLINSSTNYNRKRAAYVLKTYFCDDLTPINVAAPDAGHAGDRHASDASCQACHYKLDPMAGFFADRGILGLDFKNSDIFYFDDGVNLHGKERQDYRANWPTSGYIRSARNPGVNDYGQSFDDLAAIMRRAPEVRQCLVRRMAEYFLGKDQVFDGAWLAQLERHFADDDHSGQAFKAIVKDLLLSHTFQEPDPIPDQCYDRVSGNNDEALPCAVAHVIRNNCLACHSHITPGSQGLDLGRWIVIDHDAHGKPMMGFPHQDTHGRQWDRSRSFAIIRARMSSTDPEQAMPYKRDMSAVDRARLYKWLAQE